jgi:hypothetical protein
MKMNMIGYATIIIILLFKDSANKTDRHDITEIVLKVVLRTITLTPMFGTIFTSHLRFCNSLEIGHELMNI